jgi:hypothetical protein
LEFSDERSTIMGLFDAIREKATELMSGATDKIEEVTGGIPDGQAVEDLTQSATDTVTETQNSIGEQIDPYRP